MIDEMKNVTLTCKDFNAFEWILDDINDERLEIETLFTSTLGIAISVTSSLISTCSSILVIYIIMRSVKGLKESVYHRILFGMSIFDILQSLAIAFVTLPMPKDMIYQQFQGPVLGNDFTCRTQGFLLSLGSITGVMYNMMLSIYYLCSIRYDMPDEGFSKCLEPWLHVMCICFGSLIAVLLIIADGLNPNPVQSNWCAANSYPYYCSFFVSKEKQKLIEYGGIFIVAVAVVTLIVLLSSMTLIMLKGRRQRMDAANDYDSEQTASRPLRGTRAFALHTIQMRIQEQQLHDMKTTSRQALAYTIINLYNYFMIFALPMMRNFMNNPVPPTWWQVMVAAMRPLQGLLNCIIFFYHKVNSLQRNDRSLELWSALKMVVGGIEGETRIVSDLMLVRHHTALSQVAFVGDTRVEEDIDDESEEDEEEKEEENATDSKDDRVPLCVSPGFTNMEINDDEANEEPNDDNDAGDPHHCGDQFSLILGSDIANDSNENSIENEQNEETREVERERRYYECNAKSFKRSVRVLDDGQESSQDLSGFHCSLQPLPVETSDSMSFSLESQHFN